MISYCRICFLNSPFKQEFELLKIKGGIYKKMILHSFNKSNKEKNMRVFDEYLDLFIFRRINVEENTC